MASDLFTPILNLRTRSPNFFNGRLLTGEAMTDEQRAQRVVHELMTQAIGDGVAYGLEVTLATGSNTIDRPVVSVASGVAMNRCGEVLLLAADTQVQLVRPADPAPDPGTIFHTCSPVSSGTYIADAGLYLLTMTSIRSGKGLAQVSGLGDTPRACNLKYVVDAVEFRLLELPLADELLANPNRLRNAVAYQCFGLDQLADFATDPFGTTAEPQTLLDQIRGTELTDCDVPLAILYWTATSGVQWIDLWAVRRRITHTKAASTFGLDDGRMAKSEAMREQFLAQLGGIVSGGGSLGTYTARTNFRWLPPAAFLPVGGSGHPGFSAPTFFFGKPWNRHTIWPAPVFMEGGMLEPLLRQSAMSPPIDLDDPEMIWLYSVRENMRALHTGRPVQPYTVFANADIPFQGEPRIDRSHWGYSNFL